MWTIHEIYGQTYNPSDNLIFNMVFPAFYRINQGLTITCDTADLIDEVFAGSVRKDDLCLHLYRGSQCLP